MMDGRDSWTDILGLKLILDSAETTTIFARPSQSTPSVSCVVSEATPSSKSIGGEIEFRSSSQSCVGRNAKSVVEGDFQRWIFVESLRRGRRRRRAVQTSLALLPVLLSLPLARRFWSAHPSLDSQAGFWEREVLGNSPIPYMPPEDRMDLPRVSQ